MLISKIKEIKTKKEDKAFSFILSTYKKFKNFCLTSLTNLQVEVCIESLIVKCKSKNRRSAHILISCIESLIVKCKYIG